jgi:dinuclear metal center YbgI/SA1388 family protein
MTTHALDKYIRSILDIDKFAASDISMNGIQVDNDGANVTKAAFAVDACLETFKRAKAADAGLLFVHHGLYWGSPLRIEGTFRQRTAFLLNNNIALYAAHLPLDQHPIIGNNAVAASLLGLTERQPFGLYHGIKIGYKGILQTPLTVDQAAKRLLGAAKPLGAYPFGVEKCKTCAVITGGAAAEVTQAIEEDCDLYITGEMGHFVYHQIMEAKINMIACGHYASEVFGVQAIMQKCETELNIDTEFIDAPTGL